MQNQDFGPWQPSWPQDGLQDLANSLQDFQDGLPRPQDGPQDLQNGPQDCQQVPSGPGLPPINLQLLTQSHHNRQANLEGAAVIPEGIVNNQDRSQK